MAGIIVAFDGWNASSIGWGDQGWGVGYSNVSATSELGSVSIGFGTTVYVSGIEVVGVVGNVSSSANATVTVNGVSATGYVGRFNIWSVVNTLQNPNWTLINTPQNPNWTDIAA